MTSGRYSRQAKNYPIWHKESLPFCVNEANLACLKDSPMVSLKAREQLDERSEAAFHTRSVNLCSWVWGVRLCQGHPGRFLTKIQKWKPLSGVRGEISRVDICVSLPLGPPFCRHPGGSVWLTCHGRTQKMRVQNPQVAGFYIILFYIFYFWLRWVFTAVHRLFSTCSERRLLSSCGEGASHPGGFSPCRAWAPWSLGFGSCGSRALERKLSS